MTDSAREEAREGDRLTPVEALAKAMSADPEIFRALWPDEHGVELVAETIYRNLAANGWILADDAERAIE